LRIFSPLRSREFTRLTIRGLFAWLISVETVIISAIHHGRNNHYFCFILDVDTTQTSNALAFDVHNFTRRNISTLANEAYFFASLYSSAALCV